MPVSPVAETPKKARKLNAGNWKPGQSGNPRGRPRKALCVTSKVKVMLDEPATLPPDAPAFMKGWTRADLIAYNWILAVTQMNPPLFKEFLDRTEGKVITPFEATGKDGSPLFDSGSLLEKLKAMTEGKDGS